MATCDLREGTLLITCPTCGSGPCAPVDEKSVCGVGVAHTPCPRCLSTPATPELRAFAWEWLGFDLWKPTPVLRGWADNWYTQDDDGLWSPSAPAYLPAGRDLLARYLAHVLGLDVGATAPLWLEDVDGWWLWLGAGSGHLLSRDKYPTLATIPAAAPLMLRAARALVLVTEEVTNA